MQPLLKCCQPALSTESAAVHDDPFSQIVVIDYYDGPAAGLAKCKVGDTEYYFYLLDWDEMHNVRIFALAQLPDSSLARLYHLFRATPDEHVWIPPWPKEEQLAELYDKGIQEIVDAALPAKAVMAWSVRAEKTLAIRGVDTTLEAHMKPLFDRESPTGMFDWFDYLELTRSPQVVRS